MRYIVLHFIALAFCLFTLVCCCNPQAANGEYPDLAMTAISSPSAPVAAGAQWTLGATVENIGTVAANSFSLEYRLSADGLLDISDPIIESISIPGLDPGAKYEDLPFLAPSVDSLGGGSGTWQVFAVADSQSQVLENDEANNRAQATLKVLYETVVIDTYDPVGPNRTIGFTYMDLFGPAGDTPIGGPPPQTYDVWGTPSDQTAALSWSNGGNAPDPEHLGFANIAYADGVEPGVYYYVRIRGQNNTDVGAYAIRLLSAVPNPSIPRDASWYPGENTADPAGLPVEGGQGLPTSYLDLTLNGKLSRYIYADEVDWVRFILP